MAGRVRQPIDVKALEAYIDAHVPEIQTPVDVKQFGFGQSNPTYQLTSPDGTRYVLRKKPPGRLVSKTAHKVEREHRVLAALGGTDVPVPRALHLCAGADADAAGLGTPFYLMTFLDGRILEDVAMPSEGEGEGGGEGRGRGRNGRAALWRAAAETLARLHRLDVARVGLAGFGRLDGFYARQVRTWDTICRAQGAARDLDTGEPVGALPHFDDMVAFFEDGRRQPRDRATVVHGDYKIDNLVFHKTEPRVIGILDWEMSTIGHPLSDLANMLIPFYTARQPGAHPDPGSGSGSGPGSDFLATPGLPDPNQILAWYAAVAGWTYAPAELKWGLAFALFRLAAITQGIAARAAARQATSAKARTYAAARGPLAELAWRLICEVEAEPGPGSGGARL